MSDPVPAWQRDLDAYRVRTVADEPPRTCLYPFPHDTDAPCVPPADPGA
jgi:hypothetical protein